MSYFIVIQYWIVFENILYFRHGYQWLLFLFAVFAKPSIVCQYDT